MERKRNGSLLARRRGRKKSCHSLPALDNFDKALDVARKLHESEPERVDWSRELSLSLKYTAEAQEALGQIEGARENYEASLLIDQILLRRQAADESVKRMQEIQMALSQLGSPRPPCVVSSSR
jgi:hypothetical protein